MDPQGSRYRGGTATAGEPDPGVRRKGYLSDTRIRAPFSFSASEDQMEMEELIVLPISHPSVKGLRFEIAGLGSQG